MAVVVEDKEEGEEGDEEEAPTTAMATETKAAVEDVGGQWGIAFRSFRRASSSSARCCRSVRTTS